MECGSQEKKDNHLKNRGLVSVQNIMIYSMYYMRYAIFDMRFIYIENRISKILYLKR